MKSQPLWHSVSCFLKTILLLQSPDKKCQYSINISRINVNSTENVITDEHIMLRTLFLELVSFGVECLLWDNVSRLGLLFSLMLMIKQQVD